MCGQSAGAGSIATLLVMPLAAGLFRRAIAQTVPGMYCTPALATDIAAALAARLGAAPTATELAAIDPQRLADEVVLISSAHADRWGRAAYVGAPFCPVGGDGCWEVLSREPMLRSRIFRRVNITLLTGEEVCALMGT